MELPKAYDPKGIEETLYNRWMDSGLFNPDVCVEKNVCKSDAPVFSVMMPPPNVTGVLHLGHAFENTILDIQTRYQRMLGKRTLFLPGTDHAAVATQARVEKKLMDEKGIEDPRKELGREKLLEEIRAYAENSKKTIIHQVQKMGSSCDWSRLAYTFDEERSKTVNEIFVRMYNDGLIYRGYKVVNWSVKGQSTCSDDELVYKTRTSKIYTFKYSKDFPITIATTRPETKLGDTAVAVHPEDDRYKDFIGKTYTVDVGALKPLEIKIIGDTEVDPEYGTGALGVTPAHSPVDFEMYERGKRGENLEIDIIQVIGADGKMTKEAGPQYEGLTVEDAREKFVSWLKENDLLEKEEEIEQNVSTSDRFKDIVEAIPMTQWFIDVNKIIPGKEKSLKQLMKEAVATGHNNNPEKKITILPARFEKIYYNWIDNLRDWCISRQIWWGHQIPVWYHKETGEIHVSHNGPENPADYTRDEDTLDTWFSSGMWPFSTLNWHESLNGQLPDNHDFKQFYPTSWMQMGYEILFFWMARMILMSTYALDEIPFKDVYIHGMLRAKDGQKFSKSLGNGIDPLDMIDQYGTDALRLSLISDVSPGQDSRFYEEKVEYFRNFVNKLWNISRFIFTKVETVRFIKEKPQAKTHAQEWILNKLEILTQTITNDLNAYQFSQAVEPLRDFTWHEFADWYIEIAKKEDQPDEVLLYVLQNILKLAHPMMPFITEHIWEKMTELAHEEKSDASMLLVQSWPTFNSINNIESLDEFENLKNFIVDIRNARSEKKIEPAKLITLEIETEDEFIKANEYIIKFLARVENISYAKETQENSIKVVSGKYTAYIPLDGLIDLEAEKVRIEKQIAELKPYINSLEKKLSNEQFVNNAPAQVVEKEKEKLAKAKEELENLQ